MSSVFSSSWTYHAERKWLWKWQIIAENKFMLNRDGTQVRQVEMDNLSKSAAIGFAKLLNDQGV